MATQYPTDFYNKLPSPKQRPHYMFFAYVRAFLSNVDKSDFSKSINMRTFNHSLTTAIHKDLSREKDVFHRFQRGLQTVENAFEYRMLDEVYAFFDRFEDFAKKGLARNYRWQEFEEYSKSLTGFANLYRDMKRRFSITDGKLTWPAVNYFMAVRKPNKLKKRRALWLRINTFSKPLNHMAIVAIKNLRLAANVYSKLLDLLEPQFLDVVDWLGKTTCWVHFFQEFKEAHGKLLAEILRAQANHENDIRQVRIKLRTAGNQAKINYLVKAAENSILDVNFAYRVYPQMLARQKRMVKDVVLKVYNHALSLLAPFKTHANSVYALGVSGKLLPASERKAAQVAASRWMGVLKTEKAALVNSATINHYMTNLPYLYECMAHFSFISVAEF